MIHLRSTGSTLRMRTIISPKQWTLTPVHAMLMCPSKDETAVHGCHCSGDMAVRMRKVLAITGNVPCGLFSPVRSVLCLHVRSLNKSR